MYIIPSLGNRFSSDPVVVWVDEPPGPHGHRPHDDGLASADVVYVRENS